MASFFTTLPLASPAHPSLKVLPSTSIPWACKVENELDPSHVLPCCHLVSFLFFRLKWPQNIGSSEIVRISNRVIYAGRDLSRSQESVDTSSSSLVWEGASTFGGVMGCCLFCTCSGLLLAPVLTTAELPAQLPASPSR